MVQEGTEHRKRADSFGLVGWGVIGESRVWSRMKTQSSLKPSQLVSGNTIPLVLRSSPLPRCSSHLPKSFIFFIPWVEWLRCLVLPRLNSTSTCKGTTWLNFRAENRWVMSQIDFWLDLSDLSRLKLEPLSSAEESSSNCWISHPSNMQLLRQWFSTVGLS